ncbi:hypothetical protein AB0E69_26380 [Kribbella sp. NPDC026611]|uniref:hypothetical protein n=1 Tax=Kribbella sp. NPDC026611 TaxID=3154911 RepID=UPI0033C94504
MYDEEGDVITVGGVDTYYDYDEHQWKFRRLGGGPIHAEPAELKQESARESVPERAKRPARAGRKASAAKAADG